MEYASHCQMLDRLPKVDWFRCMLSGKSNFKVECSVIHVTSYLARCDVCVYITKLTAQSTIMCAGTDPEIIEWGGGGGSNISNLLIEVHYKYTLKV